MGLLQAGFLAAMAALAVPVLIHLLSRWQVRRLEFGTMQFLQEVIHDSAHSRRIRRWLLLTTRMILVVLLAMLFARPYVPERAAREGDLVRLVLIDRSASMSMPGQSGRLIDDAISAGVQAVNQLGGEAIIHWAWFDQRVEPMPAGTSRPQPPNTTSGGTDYFAALSWARDRLATHPTSDAGLILVTDLQQSGLVGGMVAAHELAFPDDVPVRIIDVGRAAANNLAIVNLAPSATALRPNQNVKVSATVYNYGSFPAEEIPITATASSGKRSVRLKKTLSLPNDQAGEVTFDFGPLEPGTWRVTIDIDFHDDLASDNRRLTAVQVVNPIEILVIDPGSREVGAAAVSYFLVTALQQGTRLEPVMDAGADEPDKSSEPTTSHRFVTDVLYLEAESRQLDNAKQPLIVVADAGSVPLRMVQQLETYVRGGGRLLVFSGAQIAEATADQWSQCELAPGKLLQSESAAAMPFRIVSLSPRGSMLEPFRDPQHGDLARLAFRSLVKTDIQPSTQVLAWFDQERPALTQHSLGRGRVAWFLSAADNTASNWTTSPLYLPLIQQMASDLLGLTGEGPIRFRSVGDIQQADLSQKIELGNKPQSLASLSETIYLDQPGFDERDEALYVINLSAKESDTARVNSEAFADHFDLTLAIGDGESTLGTIDSPQRRELWPWLAAALLVLLVVEFSLSNRTSA